MEGCEGEVQEPLRGDAVSAPAAGAPRSKKALVIGLAAAAAVLVAGGAWWFLRGKTFVEPPPVTDIADAYVILHDDHGFRDRKFTIRYDTDIENFDLVQSDDGETGFGDKASSIKWQVPDGYEFRLYDDHGYRDTPLRLSSNGGRYQEHRDLDGQSFGDKASSGRWFRTAYAPVTSMDQAWVEFYEDDGHRGRRVRLTGGQDVDDFDNVASDDGQQGFGDLTSSLRWQIPAGHKLVLYDDNGHRDRSITLEGRQGQLQEIADLKASDFGDKTSSARWMATAPPPVTRIEDAYVELFDDVGFGDRKARIAGRVDVANFDRLASEGGQVGFGDKTSSIRWQIPPGWTFVLHDDADFKDRSIKLEGGDGKLREIRDLDAEDFGDKASSGRWLASSPAPVTRLEDAYVELYDDTGFADRRTIVRGGQDVVDFDTLDFGDKASSLRWQIPPNYQVLLHDDRNHRDRFVLLESHGGRLVSMKDLASRNFSDKASSLRWIDPRKGFVRLYDDDGFRDRSVLVLQDRNDRDFKTVSSEDGSRGFGDKASSVVWNIPINRKYVLFEDYGFRGRRLELTGSGRLGSIGNLDDRDFGDRASSGRWEEVQLRR